MAQHWFYSSDGGQTQLGPLTGSELKDRAGCGKLQPTDMIWREGLPKWVEARQVKGLFSNSPGNSSHPSQKPRPPSPSTSGSMSANGTQAVQDPHGLEEEVRAKMSSYARKIPHHGIDDFGEVVELQRITEIAAYKCKLQTLHEKREPIARFKPYKGEALPPLNTTVQNISVFSLQLPMVDDFTTTEREFPVDDSQAVAPCEKCGCRGEIECPGCDGRQRVQCSRCAGTRTETCRVCHGSGAIDQSRTLQSTKNCPSSFCKGGIAFDRVCDSCNGRGWVSEIKTVYDRVPCTGCGACGNVVCRGCGGKGMINCPKCSAKGVVTCSDCDGYKRIIRYVAIMQSFKPNIETLDVVDPTCANEPVALLEHPIDFDPLADVTVIEFTTDPALPSKSRALSDAVHRTIQQSRVSVGDNTRIVKQNLQVDGSVIIKSNYNYDDMGFVFCLVGNRRRVYAFPSPLAEIARSLLGQARYLWTEKLRFAAASRMNKVLEMAQSDTYCQAAVASEPPVPAPLKLLAHAKNIDGFAEAIKWSSLLLGVICPAAAAFLAFATFAGFRGFHDLISVVPFLNRDTNSFVYFILLPLGVLLGHRLLSFWNREETAETTYAELSTHQNRSFGIQRSPLTAALMLAAVCACLIGLLKIGRSTVPTPTPVATTNSTVPKVNMNRNPGGSGLTRNDTPPGQLPTQRSQPVGAVSGPPLEVTQETLRLVGHKGVIGSVCVSPDGRQILSAGWDRTVRLWEVGTGREVRCLNGHTKDVNIVVFTPDGRRAISGSRDKTIRVWDLETGLESLLMEAGGQVECVSITPDGLYAASCADWIDPDTKPLQVWSLRTGQEVNGFGDRSGGYKSISVSSDGRYALTGEAGDDALMRLWDIKSGEEVRQFAGHRGSVNGVAFSPNSRLALSAGEDYTVRLWNVDTGRELHRFEGHKRGVERVTFSADGRRFLSGSRDGSMSLWDIDQRRELCFFTGHNQPVNGVAFTPDGRFALSASWDYVRLWKLNDH